MIEPSRLAKAGIVAAARSSPQGSGPDSRSADEVGTVGGLEGMTAGDVASPGVEAIDAGRERYRRAGLSAITAIAARAVSMAVSIRDGALAAGAPGR